MEKEVKRKEIFKAAVPTGTALAIVHSFAVWQRLYYRVPWIDIPLHFWGGALLALGFYWFFYRFSDYFDLDKSFSITLFFLLGWAALGGVLWEFGEFLYDNVVLSVDPVARAVQFGLADTLGDLAFDLLGALAVALFMRLRYHKKRRA